MVIPAFNEAGVVAGTLDSISSYLRGTGLTYELVIVDDGSTDRTAEVVREAGERDRSIRLVRLAKNQGKGSAVRAGVQEAKGDVIAFIDADLPYSVQNLGDAIALVQSGSTDIAIGARDLATSDFDPSYPFLRRLMGKT